MAEIKKELIFLVEGTKYTANAGDVLIKDEHTLADIVRYLVKVGTVEDVQYLLNEHKEQING